MAIFSGVAGLFGKGVTLTGILSKVAGAAVGIEVLYKILGVMDEALVLDARAKDQMALGGYLDAERTARMQLMRELSQIPEAKQRQFAGELAGIVKKRSTETSTNALFEARKFMAEATTAFKRVTGDDDLSSWESKMEGYHSKEALHNFTENKWDNPVRDQDLTKEEQYKQSLIGGKRGLGFISGRYTPEDFDTDTSWGRMEKQAAKGLNLAIHPVSSLIKWFDPSKEMFPGSTELAGTPPKGEIAGPPSESEAIKALSDTPGLGWLKEASTQQPSDELLPKEKDKLKEGIDQDAKPSAFASQEAYVEAALRKAGFYTPDPSYRDTWSEFTGLGGQPQYDPTASEYGAPMTADKALQLGALGGTHQELKERWAAEKEEGRGLRQERARIADTASQRYAALTIAQIQATAQQQAAKMAFLQNQREQEMEQANKMDLERYKGDPGTMQSREDEWKRVKKNLK